MLIPSESEFPKAVKKLQEAGFREAPWSYDVVDPSKVLDDPSSQFAAADATEDFQNLNTHSERYLFPLLDKMGESSHEGKVVLLRGDYVHLYPPHSNEDGRAVSRALSGDMMRLEGNIYWPAPELLLESFIKTLLQEGSNEWELTLVAWAISYVYGYLDVGVDVLDGCADEDVKRWFNNKIRRDQGGLDEARTKRHGKVTKWVEQIDTIRYIVL